MRTSVGLMVCGICVSFLYVEVVSAGGRTYTFDDGSASTIAGQSSAVLSEGGIPLTVTAGLNGVFPGGSGTTLTAVSPGSIPGLPQIAGIGVSSSSDFGSAVSRGEQLRFTVDPRLEIREAVIRTFGSTSALSINTYPMPGSTNGSGQVSSQVLSSYYPGTSNVTRLSFAPGVTQFDIAAIIGQQTPALLVMSIEGKLVPEAGAVALVSVGIGCCVALLRRHDSCRRCAV